MSGSEEQHDEQPAKAAAPGDVVRDAVERTLRDTAAALQRLAPPSGTPARGAEADTVVELTARIEELTARVERLESKVKKLKKASS